MPFLSVIIPVFNREAYLRETIESVLGQTRPADEIIVINDGSTDGSEKVARSFGDQVRCLTQPNGGIGAARNAGLDRARGDLIAFLDSDDLWISNKLELQEACLTGQPDLDLVFCRMKPFLSPEIDPGKMPAFDGRESAGCSSSGLLAHRRIFQALGPFEVGLRVGEFVSWFARAKEKGISYRVLSEVLFRRRVHFGNSVKKSEARVDYVRVLKRQLDRRRAAAGQEQ